MIAVKTKEILAASFVFFGGLLVWPLLTMANRPVLIAGIPALVVYLFTVWAAIVIVLFLARPPSGAEEPP